MTKPTGITLMLRLPLLCLALFCLVAGRPLAAAEYRIDSSHTYASFEIDHLGFSTQRGWFAHTAGSIEFDAEARRGSLDIRIAAASIDTGFKLRDEVLRGQDWFNTEDFPDILFRSQHLVFDEQRPVAIEGTLTLLGVSRPMRLDINRFKCGLNLVLRQRGCGADAQGVLRRSDFGLSNGLPFIGDEVRLRIQVEAYQP